MLQNRIITALRTDACRMSARCLRVSSASFMGLDRVYYTGLMRYQRAGNAICHNDGCIVHTLCCITPAHSCI